MHESCSCGCGHDHGQHSHSRAHADARAPLTQAQEAFLHHLEHHHFLPVARFLVERSGADDFSSVALAPVYLRAPDEGMEDVKETAAMLLALEEAGLISLDYDYPLEGYPYPEYLESDLYAFFCKTVEEAAGRPGFLGDTPRLELGSIALAEHGEE